MVKYYHVQETDQEILLELHADRAITVTVDPSNFALRGKPITVRKDETHEAD